MLKRISPNLIVAFAALAAIVAAGVAYAEVQGDDESAVADPNTATPVRNVTQAPTFGPTVIAHCPDDPALPCEVEGSDYTPVLPTKTPRPQPSATHCAATVILPAGEPYQIFGADAPDGKWVTNSYDTLADSCTGEWFGRDPVTGEEFSFEQGGDYAGPSGGVADETLAP
jgi:hypothetical protein